MEEETVLSQIKISLNPDKTKITIYVWKKTYLWFGKWVKATSSIGYNTIKEDQYGIITNKNIINVIYNNFLKTF